MTDLPKGFKLVNGLVWPEMDEDCARVIFNMRKDLDVVESFVRDWSACIQAGGNCGVWARALAPKFKTIYTMEPHPLNFIALAHNTAGLHNVVRLQCALGYKRELIGLELADHEKKNCGAFYVTPAGFVPVLRIDDLALPTCGLVYLDIEGFEMEALKGAAETIRRCLPTIVIEDKGLSEKYGTRKGDCEKWLQSEFGYHVAKRINRDVVLVHKDVIP